MKGFLLKLSDKDRAGLRRFSAEKSAGKRISQSSILRKFVQAISGLSSEGIVIVVDRESWKIVNFADTVDVPETYEECHLSIDFVKGSPIRSAIGTVEKKEVCGDE